MVALLLLQACTGAPPDAPTDTGDTGAAPDTADTADTSDTAHTDTDTAETGDTADTDTGDPAPPDVDGDGYGDIAHGGDDCDDDNAYIHPGAPEYCDTVDQDCDGEPLGEAMCGEVIPIDATGTPLTHSNGLGVLGLLGDLTGDGYHDLVGSYDSAYRIYAGGPANEAPFDDTLAGVWHRVSYPAWGTQAVHDGGDMNGDGWDDLVFVSSEGYGARVRYGPFEGGGAASTINDDDVRWSDGYYSAQPAFTGTDIDGDGRADLATNEDDYAHVTEDAFQVFFGGEPDTECALLDAYPYGTAAPIGDGDGDGITETAWRGDGGTWILSGADLRGACGGYLEDYAVGKVTRGSGGGTPVPRVRLGDWDGDGVDEWMATRLASAGEGEEGMWAFSAGASVTGDFTTDDAAGSWVILPGGGSYSWPSAADLDADGVNELLVTGPEFLVIRGGSPLTIAADPPERTLRFAASVCASWPCGRDFDGDGYNDMLARHGDDDTGLSLSPLLPGFDIPWDHDTRW